MTRFLARMLLVLAMTTTPVLTGCATLGGLFPSEDYTATLTATGIVPIGPVSLATIPVPENGTGLIALAVVIAGKHMAAEHNLDKCLFETYPATLVGRRIEVTATAICKLEGIPVQEAITLVLEPVAPTA